MRSPAEYWKARAITEQLDGCQPNAIKIGTRNKTIYPEGKSTEKKD